MTTRVVNKNQEAYDVYIGRPSKWGNPFIVGVHGTRKEVIQMYRVWLPKQKHLMSSLHELEDKTLGCHCKPKSCHGDILAEFVNARSRPSLFRR